MPKPAVNYLRLSQDPVLLRAMAEFVARCRVFGCDSPLLNEKIKHELYSRYLAPLLTKEKQEFASYIKLILNKTLAKAEYNNMWAIYFITSCAQPSSNLWPLRRPLLWEFYIHAFGLFLAIPNDFLKNKQAKKDLKNLQALSFSQRTTYLSSLLDKKINYLKEHLPDNFFEDKLISLSFSGPIIFFIYDIFFNNNYLFNIYALIVLAISITSMVKNKIMPQLLSVFCSMYQFCFVEYRIGLILPISFVLFFAMSALKPSYFHFHNMPGNLNHGLISELQEHIQALRGSNHPDYKPLPYTLSEDPASKQSNSSGYSTSLFSKSSCERGDELSHTKLKERKGAEPAARSAVELPAPVVHCWITKNYTLVTYQEGKPSSEGNLLIPLWFSSQNLVVIFPKDTLQGDRDLIHCFQKTAVFGHIVPPTNHAGFVEISNTEKSNKKYAFSKDTFFKIKTPPHSKYGDYRAPVDPCLLAPEDEPTPNRPMLLEVGSPIRLNHE